MESEKVKFHQELNFYKSELEKKEQILVNNDILITKLQTEKEHDVVTFTAQLEQLQKEKQILEKIVQAESVDDTILFHWMTVAIRLDFMMHNKGQTSNFDRSTMYDQLKEENVPYMAWPKRILNEIVAANNHKNSTKKSTKK